MIWIEGEPFKAEDDGKHIYLTHIEWPIRGEGLTVYSAEADLRDNARIMEGLYSICSDEEFTEDEWEYRSLLQDLQNGD